MPLRDYQEQALAGVSTEWKQGARAVLLVLPTGGGKTAIASEAIRRAVSRGRRCLFIAHRRELIAQTSQRLTAEAISHGIVMADSARSEAPVQVCSVDTLRARAERPGAELVIWDECFPAGTLIDGRPIESFRVGELVCSYNHTTHRKELRPILRLFRSRPSSLLTITLQGGAKIVCTHGHPFSTPNGYVPAIQLQPGDRVHADPAMLHLPSRDPKPDKTSNQRSATTEERVLLQRSYEGIQAPGLIGDDGTDQPQVCLCSNEDQQSDAQIGGEGICLCRTAGDGTQTDRSGRQRQGYPEATGAAGESSLLENRGCGSHETAQGERISGDLQDRYRGHDSQDRDRGGWPQSLRADTPSTGQEKGSILVLARVDHIEVHEQTSDGRFGGLCPDGAVYNIEVAHNHNYYAGGVLVHNCHHQASEGWRLVAADYPEAHHIGLTATPVRADGKGLGDLFQAMVVGATAAELTARGFLVPCDIVAPASKLTRALAQDPVDALLSLGTDAAGQWPKTLVYARSVKESHLLAERYQAAGVSAAAIDGTTRADVRDEVLRRFADGSVRVIVNMAVLTEGFDVPDASVCIVARSVGHVGLWLQIVGRVLRPAPGKERAIVLDLAGSVHEHGLPEDERRYSLDAGIAKAPALPALGLCRMCGALKRGYPCPRCGFTPPEVRLSITGEPLVLVSGRFNSKDEKTAVDALAAVAAAKGYSPGWITHEFKKRYGYEIGQQRYVAARAHYKSLRAAGVHHPG